MNFIIDNSKTPYEYSNVPQERFFGRDISNINCFSDLNKKFTKNTLALSNACNNLGSFRDFKKDSSKICSDEKTHTKELTKKIVSSSQAKKDPQKASEYSGEIFIHLKETENVNIPDYNKLFSHQRKYNLSTRLKLIEWVIYIHYKLRLLPETLYLAVNIIDSFTELSEIELNDCTLLSVTGLLIASKFEEIYAPEISDFIYLAHNSITKQQILSMEYKILSLLNYDILFNSSYKFLEYFYNTSSEEKQNVAAFHLAQYILEICLINVDLMKYSQSVRAASALYMARKILDNIAWSHELKFHSGYSERDIKKCVKDMVIFLQRAIRHIPHAIYIKFCSKEFSSVGSIFSLKPQRIK